METDKCEWVTRCSARMHAQWPRIGREQRDDLATELWADTPGAASSLSRRPLSGCARACLTRRDPAGGNDVRICEILGSVTGDDQCR